MLLSSANRQSYRPMPRRLAQQRMTLSDLEWPFHASRAISTLAELLVSQVVPSSCIKFSFLCFMYFLWVAVSLVINTSTIDRRKNCLRNDLYYVLGGRKTLLAHSLIAT